MTNITPPESLSAKEMLEEIKKTDRDYSDFEYNVTLWEDRKVLAKDILRKLG